MTSSTCGTGRGRGVSRAGAPASAQSLFPGPAPSAEELDAADRVLVALAGGARDCHAAFGCGAGSGAAPGEGQDAVAHRHSRADGLLFGALAGAAAHVDRPVPSAPELPADWGAGLGAGDGLGDGVGEHADDGDRDGGAIDPAAAAVLEALLAGEDPMAVAGRGASPRDALDGAGDTSDGRDGDGRHGAARGGGAPDGAARDADAGDDDLRAAAGGADDDVVPFGRSRHRARRGAAHRGRRVPLWGGALAGAAAASVVLLGGFGLVQTAEPGSALWSLRQDIVGTRSVEVELAAMLDQADAAARDGDVEKAERLMRHCEELMGRIRDGEGEREDLEQRFTETGARVRQMPGASGEHSTAPTVTTTERDGREGSSETLRRDVDGESPRELSPDAHRDRGGQGSSGPETSGRGSTAPSDSQRRGEMPGTPGSPSIGVDDDVATRSGEGLVDDVGEGGDHGRTTPNSRVTAPRIAPDAPSDDAGDAGAGDAGVGADTGVGDVGVGADTGVGDAGDGAGTGGVGDDAPSHDPGKVTDVSGARAESGAVGGVDAPGAADAAVADVAGTVGTR